MGGMEKLIGFVATNASQLPAEGCIHPVNPVHPVVRLWLGLRLPFGGHCPFVARQPTTQNPEPETKIPCPIRNPSRSSRIPRRGAIT
jgi:hypothetical protein